MQTSQCNASFQRYYEHSAITQLPNANIKSHAQNMNTAQTLSSEKQHISHSFILFTSQNSTQPENYLYHKNDICVCVCVWWGAMLGKIYRFIFTHVKWSFLFIYLLIYLFYFIIFFFLGLYRGKKSLDTLGT